MTKLTPEVAAQIREALDAVDPEMAVQVADGLTAVAKTELVALVEANLREELRLGRIIANLGADDFAGIDQLRKDATGKIMGEVRPREVARALGLDNSTIWRWKKSSEATQSSPI